MSTAIAAQAFPRRFVAPLYTGSALNPVNSSMIATALVPIAHDMHVSVGRTSVLVAALYLASAVAQPTMGRLSEEFGPRRVFVIGILLVAGGGLLGGLAQTLATLVVARVLIGIGTSTAYPSAMVVIRRRAADAGLGAPPGSVLGGLAIAAQVTVALGLPVGGLLVGLFSWRATLFANVPVALVTLAMALAWLPRDAAREKSASVRELASRIDLGGIAGFAGAMTALLVFVMSLPRPDWIALALAVVLAVALVARELRAATPFFDVRLLASNLALTRTYLRTLLSFLGIYTVLYGITQWIEDGRGLSPAQAGLLILPMSALGALLSAPIARRNLVRGPLIAAAVASLMGSVAVLFFTSQTSVLAIIGVTLLFGVTTGAGTVANQTALYAQAPAAHVGTAAGLLRTFAYMGSIASSTVTAIVFRTSASDAGLHLIAAILAGVMVLLLAMTLADRQLGRTARSAGRDR